MLAHANISLKPYRVPTMWILGRTARKVVQQPGAFALAVVKQFRANQGVLLAGAVAVDGPADFGLQYHNFPRLTCDAECLSRGWGPIGLAKQKLARREIGGTPESVPAKFAQRSPISYVRQIAESCVPVQIWWSRTDETVLDSARQSGRMFEALRQRDPRAVVEEFVGDWPHTDAMRSETDLPRMLSHLGLLPQSYDVEVLDAAHSATSPDGSCAD